MWILLGIYTLVGLVMLGLALGLAGATQLENTPFANTVDFPGWNLVFTEQFDVTTGTAAAIAAILGILNLVAAWGLWTLQRWAWGVAIALAVIGLLFVPVGTVLGIVTLVYLFTRPVRYAYRHVTGRYDEPGVPG